MKTVTLIRVDQTGIYALPDDLTFNQVHDIHVNSVPLVLDQYKILTDNKQIDIFVSNINDPSEIVTVEVE
jgi:hypothetical protein